MKTNKDTHLRHNSSCSYESQAVTGLVTCFVHNLAFLFNLKAFFFLWGGGGVNRR